LPEKTAEELRENGFFITGDLGVIDERGYVSIVGRAKDLIICGGFNVYPAEVEALIDAIPGIAESAVIGIPHADMGEGVVAVVQARDPELDEAKVMAAIAGDLARFKQPRRVIFLPELPRNTMGKIQKKRCAKPTPTCSKSKPHPAARHNLRGGASNPFMPALAFTTRCRA
jgi:malonyl-CoA/methylmalonyl-CoA synthetase